MRKLLPAFWSDAGGAGHLLADYPANGSGHMTQLREHGIFEYPLVHNALARGGYRYYHLARYAWEPFCPVCVECDGRDICFYGIA